MPLAVDPHGRVDEIKSRSAKRGGCGSSAGSSRTLSRLHPAGRSGKAFFPRALDQAPAHAADLQRVGAQRVGRSRSSRFVVSVGVGVVFGV
jgi:hypothetical protein